MCDTGLSMPDGGPLAFLKVHCSEGPLFRRFDVPKVRCSEGSMFRRFIVPKVRYSEIKVHCSENKVQYSEKEWIYLENNSFFVVLNLLNSLMFLDLHEGRGRIQDTIL